MTEHYMAPENIPTEIIQDDDKDIFIFNTTSTTKNNIVAYTHYLITQLICNTNNKYLILHHKAFRADYMSRSTKIGAPSAARILILREF